MKDLVNNVRRFHQMLKGSREKVGCPIFGGKNCNSSSLFHVIELL